jgi:uncharacterized repeat protein (TIGR01451 family)
MKKSRAPPVWSPFVLPLRVRSILSAVLLTLLAVACLAVVRAAPAFAASADISVSADNPPPPSVPTGQASTYTINFTCSAVVGNSCGSDPTITIPLDVTSSNPATPDPSTWSYSTASTITGLITSQQVVGENLVITLNESALQAGQSDTIELSVTPPNNITPDGTTWQIEPSFQTDSIASVSAATPAEGAASAGAMLSVTKNTNDGGSVYVVGNNVIFNITARCNAGGATGNLYLTNGSLIDALPPELTFVSATPAPTTMPAVGSSGNIEWDYPTAGSLPAGCASGAGGTTAYTVVAQLAAGTPNNTSLTNNATFQGTPLGETTPQSASDPKQITAITSSPGDAGTFLSKTAVGPLSIPTFGYDATYAGNWITPINPRPSTSPGSAEGMYTINIAYPASRAFTTDLADPVPCLDTHSGVVYSSNTPAGAINGAGSIDNLCQHPAFNPTAVRVNSASLASAIADGWTPIAIEPNGDTFPLTISGSAGTSTYFDVPTSPTNEIGNVAAIELPPDTNLTDVSMSMNVWGYGAVSLQGGDDLHDIATATAYPVTGGATTTLSEAADLYIEPSETQLGVLKTFGALGSGTGGTTPLNLTGNVSVAAPLTGNVVMTDLLPFGLSWANPSTSATFNVTPGLGGTAAHVTGTIADLTNFNSTGRELIRITLPASAFTSGYYTITPASANLIDLTVPTAATTYNNTAQLFVTGIADQTLPTCGPGTGTTQSTFESQDPLDLDGDGATTENYCQWAASLTVTPSGPPAFSVVKSVQGDQDSAPKFSPGIGDASQGGSGTYTLTWSSTGGAALSDPVIYDILPYVGDVGVSQGQSTVARDSQFAPTFAAITGTLPTGVTVAYSTSTNPCRPEVYPNASNLTCVNDWTTTEPADPTTIKALRFVSTGTYQPAQSFSVSFSVNVPPQFVNVVAWNSAAADANVTSSGAPLLPAEGPKVGLTAPASPLLPTVATSASAPSVNPGDPFSDAVDVANTGGASGTLGWQLVGPVAPDSNGGCDNADWTGAATVDTGTIPVAGDGTYTTATSDPTAAGCYGYVDTLTGSAWLAPVTTAAGTPGETVLVKPATLSTTASAARMLPGDKVTDSIALTGTGTNPGSGTISWRLLGPIAPAADGTCTALDWSGAPTDDSGTISISGDGTDTTASSAPTATGCYSYVDSLDAPYPGAPAASAAGAAGETVLVAVPSLSTTVSSASVLTGDQVDDAIIVHGTGGQPGSIAWTLLGPVAPAAGGGCAGVSWSGAATAAQGTLAVAGDGTYTTPVSKLTNAGCYGYEATLSGASYGPDVISAAGAGGEVAEATAPAQTQSTVDLTVTKRVNTHTATFGKPLTYTLTVNNRGPDTATDVKVTDTPVTKLRLVSAKSADGSCGHSFPVVCELRDLPAHHHATVTVVAVPRTVGDVVNGAHVTTADPNTASPKSVVSDARTTVLATLELAKRAQVRSVNAGHLAGFVITVTNPMPAAAKQARVCDQLPRGLVFSSASVKTKLRMGTVCWTIATIAPHAHKQATIVVRALGGSSGKLINHATLSGPAIVGRRADAAIKVIPAPPKPTPVTG